MTVALLFFTILYFYVILKVENFYMNEVAKKDGKKE